MDRRFLVELCEQVKNGDATAFGTIYNECYLPIFRFAYSLSLNREDAEDIAEETFLRAAKKIHSFKEGDFLSWLFAIAHNLFFDLVRDGQKTVSLADEAESIASDDENLENELLRNENAGMIKELFENLNEYERELLVLKYWRELNMKQIAEIIAKSHDATRKEYSRLIEKIRKLVNDK